MSIKKVSPNGKFKSSKYKLINPEKYIGDIHNIICRSSWEHRFCTYCDLNESIVKWSSEPVGIDYYSPIDEKLHKYYVDFYIKIKLEDETEEEWIVEIKPENQRTKPVFEGYMTTRKLKSYNDKLKTYIINQAKFRAAIKWAAKRGLKFKVIDENFLFKGDKGNNIDNNSNTE